jgi:hypothetical protein
MSTGPLAQDQQNFVWTSKFFSFYLELYKNKFKNFIRTSKFKFSFRGLYFILGEVRDLQQMYELWTHRMGVMSRYVTTDHQQRTSFYSTQIINISGMF